MTTRRAGLRIAALLAGGAFALHQLRYALGYGRESHAELGAQGHAYLTLLAPLVAVALLALAADFGARLLAARRDRRHAATAPPSLRAVWAAATGALLAAYALQESLEGALVASHPGGLGGLAGHGGWLALPLAAALGLAIALLVRGGERAIELAAERPVRLARPRDLEATGEPAPAARPRTGRSARPLGARAPPLGATA